MATPEGHVKAKLRRVLERLYRGSLHVLAGAFWLWKDDPGCSGLLPRPVLRDRDEGGRQEADASSDGRELQNIGRAMGKTFVIAGVDDPAFETLVQWLDEITETIHMIHISHPTRSIVAPFRPRSRAAVPARGAVHLRRRRSHRDAARHRRDEAASEPRLSRCRLRSSSTTLFPSADGKQAVRQAGADRRVDDHAHRQLRV